MTLYTFQAYNITLLHIPGDSRIFHASRSFVRCVLKTTAEPPAEKKRLPFRASDRAPDNRTSWDPNSPGSSLVHVPGTARCQRCH